MFCAHCGKEISSGSKFCGNCGKPVPVLADSIPNQPPATQESGELLVQLKSVSKYKGTPAAGYSEATGTLSVYIDRLEFKKKMGSALLAGSSVIGLGLAGGLARSAPVETFELEQISELREGKYMGLYNTLVVAMKNGEIWSFCPILPNSSEPQKIISLLKPYLQC